MKRNLLCLLFLIFSVSLTFAQSDSLNVVHAKWTVSKIARGVNLKQFWFNNSLFKSNQNVSIVEVKRRKRHYFDLGFEQKNLRTVSSFADSSNALAAINGTFFDIKNGGSVDFIKADGTVINDNRLTEKGMRSFHQQSAVVFEAGKISIVKWNGQAEWEQKIHADELMVTGPLLLLKSQSEILDAALSFNKTRHPRSAIAITKHKRVLFITVDGRNNNSAGMDLFEMAKLLKWLKAADGINLDGGGSTTLWVNGNLIRGVVNYPSDNKKWDHQGERKVANVILLKRK
jgi:exopolysaccharide biosynthesis protein